VCVCQNVCVWGVAGRYPNVCDRKTHFLLQIRHYLSLICVIFVVSVECIMKVIRPAMYSCYCVYCDSSYMFRLCKVAIMGLLMSAV
jgi:hypothetical protein